MAWVCDRANYHFQFLIAPREGGLPDPDPPRIPQPGVGRVDHEEDGADAAEDRRESVRLPHRRQVVEEDRALLGRHVGINRTLPTLARGWSLIVAGPQLHRDAH